MSDTETKVLITGEAGSALAAMQAAAAGVAEGVAEMTESLESLLAPFTLLKDNFTELMEVFLAVEAFEKVIEVTKDVEREAINLGRSFGISATQASIYGVAIEDVGGSADDFASASRGLTRQLKTNEKGMNDLGIVTRDANGHLLNGEQIMWNAIETVNTYTEGFDRNEAAQIAFGRAADANASFLKLTKEGMAEAGETAENLGLIVGEENVEDYKENVKAMGGLMAGLHGLGKAVGDALLPVLSQLAEMFAVIVPYAITVLKGVLGGFVAVFWIVVADLEIGVDALIMVFRMFADTVELLFEAVGEAMQGHMSTAAARLKSIGTTIARDWSTSMDQMSDDAEHGLKKITNLFASQTPLPPPKVGENVPGKGGDVLEQYKKERQEQAQAAGDWDQKDLAADQAFWQAKLAQTQGATDADKKLREDIEKILLADAKKAHDQYIKGEEEYQKTVQTLAEGELNAKREALTEAAAAGKISHAQELAGEAELENQKYAIEERALEQKLKLMQFDVLGQQKIRDQELVLAQTHQLALQKIQDKGNADGIKEEQEYEKTVEALQLGEIEAKKTALEQELATNKITQQQELAGEIALENQKYQIERQALEDKLKLAGQDLAQQQKLKDQELLLEQKHAADVQKIVNKSETDQLKTWNTLFSDMRSGFSSTIQGFLKGTTSVAGLVKGLFQDVGNSIITMISNMAAQYLETSLMQIVSSKTSGVAIIGTLAAQAAAGAFASTAAIPYVGPELAPAAAALAYADTMSYAAVASAAGGYSIPTGINPVTQLHEEEMVLPKGLSNAVRDMASRGGGGGGGLQLTVHAIDAQSFAKAINNHGSAVSAALRKLQGRFMNG